MAEAAVVRAIVVICFAAACRLKIEEKADKLIKEEEKS